MATKQPAKSAKRASSKAVEIIPPATAATTKAGSFRRTTARGFEAGSPGRRLKAIPTTAQAINSQIRQFGKNVVARSRYLATNNAYAAAAKEAFVSALVGGGIKPSSLITDKATKKALQEAFLYWTDEADADGLTDFYGLETIIAGEMFEAGECFARMRSRLPEDGLSVPFQLQLLPSEMLPTDHNEQLQNGGRIECGIEFSPIGKRVAYWFYRSHPNEVNSVIFTGTGNSRLNKIRVPAEEILHLFKPIRAGQLRGVPHTLAGIVTLSMVDLYDDAELERKRVAALFGAFVKRKAYPEDEDHPFGDEDDAGELVTDFSDRLDPNELSDFSLEPGAVIDLADGQDVAFAEPADVGSNYEAFQYRNLLRAAAGFGVPYSDMTGDLRQTSYSSIRAGIVAFRRRIESMQHQVMVFQFCRPVFKRWMQEAVVAQAIYDADSGAVMIKAADFLAKPRSYLSVKWITPKWEWVDPLKDRQAEKLAVDSGFKPRSDVIEAEGYDPEEVDQRILQDQERAGELGIKFITLSSEVIVGPNDEEEPDPVAAPGGGLPDIGGDTEANASADFDFG